MQRHTQSLNGLLGALVLSAGFASPLALADEGMVEQKQTPINGAQAQAEQLSDEGADAKEGADTEMVEVRISLPSGRTIVRLEPRRKMSARYEVRPGSNASTSRRLADGSRISVASRAVSGGSNSSSIRTGGGGGGGGGASGGGGSSSGGGSASGSASGSSASAASSKTGVFSYNPSDQSGSDDSAADTQFSADNNDPYDGVDSQASGSDSSSSGSGLGVYSYGTPTDNDDDSNENSTGDNDSGTTDTGQQATSSVPTIGDPVYDGDGNATGGQEVLFENAEMSAAVIGNTVYFNGVELVSADSGFDVIRGTPIASDTVILDERRSTSSGEYSVSSFNTQGSDIVLELESDSVVEFVMFSYSPNVMSPLREQRTWTVRIR